MKYGPIICDPTSEEAKKLIGKTVIAADFYTIIADTSSNDTVKLVEICEDECNPFKVEENGHKCGYNFIREFIEETPKYRPYKDTDEMVEDFKERFFEDIFASSVEMPRIWLRNKYSESSNLVTNFQTKVVYMGAGRFGLGNLLEDYTYLDGSPVGKEVAE